VLVRGGKRLLALVFVSVAVLGAGLVGGSADAGGMPRYEVTIINLTDGQPLTPPVIATHRSKFNLFLVGDLVSVGVMQVAENGNVPNLVSALDQVSMVDEVTAGAEPLVPAGLPGSAEFPDRATFTIGAGGGTRFISFASMLICTNDGFTGINHVRLPRDVGDRIRMTAAGYDAGTEMNTEDLGDIVPPCQGLVGVTGSDPGTGNSDPLLLEGGVVHQHAGIIGDADLDPSVHGWDDPVVRVVVERIA
jgi:hypothetical protein